MEIIMLLLAVAGVLIPIWKSTREWCGWYRNCYLRSKRQYRQRRRKRKPFLSQGRLDLIQECARWASAMGSGSRSELNASYTGYYCAYSNAERMLKESLKWESLCLTGLRQARQRLGWRPSNRAIRRQAAQVKALQDELNACQDDWHRLTRHIKLQPPPDQKLAPRRDRTDDGGGVAGGTG